MNKTVSVEIKTSFLDAATTAVGYGFKIVDSNKVEQSFFGQGAETSISSDVEIPPGKYNVFVFTYDAEKNVVGDPIPTTPDTIEIAEPTVVLIAIKAIASATVAVA